MVEKDRNIIDKMSDATEILFEKFIGEDPVKRAFLILEQFTFSMERLKSMVKHQVDFSDDPKSGSVRFAKDLMGEIERIISNLKKTTNDFEAKIKEKKEPKDELALMVMRNINILKTLMEEDDETKILKKVTDACLRMEEMKACGNKILIEYVSGQTEDFMEE